MKEGAVPTAATAAVVAVALCLACSIDVEGGGGGGGRGLLSCSRGSDCGSLSPAAPCGKSAAAPGRGEGVGEGGWKEGGGRGRGRGAGTGAAGRASSSSAATACADIPPRLKMQARAAAAWAGGRRRPALTSREESNPCPGGLGTEQSDIGEADKEEGRAHDARAGALLLILPLPAAARPYPLDVPPPNNAPQIRLWKITSRDDF